MMMLTALAGLLWSYPLDDFDRTQIRRLEWQQAIENGESRGRKLHSGATWSAEEIRLRLDSGPGRSFRLTPDSVQDPELRTALEKVTTGGFQRYGIAIVDMTDPARIRFAGHNEHLKQTPGSVAKLLVATGFLGQVARHFPVPKDREAFLRTTSFTADDWAQPNHHEVPVVKKGQRTRVRRVVSGDVFTAWEWLDHALSPSSNAAATMVWREAAYLSDGATTAAALSDLEGSVVPAGARDAWARTLGRAGMAEVAFDVVEAPIRDAGIEVEDFHVRTFFTTRPGRYLAARSSRATPFAVVQWALAMEQGRLVDPWTSRELKKLIYLTRRRIRYAYAKELRDSAVYFKSGSLYGCKPEKDFSCGKYRGNRINVLNSLAIVETRRPSKPMMVYAVAVMSNVLKRNASYDHAVLAGRIHEMMLELHP
ncbi:MAG: hypothetical protein ACFB9M_12715 [Myxococcota bacterium]